MLTTMYTLQTSTSSSSSSPSGAATPVDVIEPELVSFPRVAQAQPIRGLRSSGSSVFSLEHQRPPFKAALPFVPRPPKLSLDTRNVRPIPALPSASTESPLGAFCPTSSAESHLRYLVEYSILNPLPTRPGPPVSNHSPTPASTTHSRSRSISSFLFSTLCAKHGFDFRFLFMNSIEYEVCKCQQGSGGGGLS